MRVRSQARGISLPRGQQEAEQGEESISGLRPVAQASAAIYRIGHVILIDLAK